MGFTWTFPRKQATLNVKSEQFFLISLPPSQFASDRQSYQIINYKEGKVYFCNRSLCYCQRLYCNILYSKHPIDLELARGLIYYQNLTSDIKFYFCCWIYFLQKCPRKTKSNTRCGRGDGSVVSSSALFQTRGLNLAIVSSRSVILTPTIVYISARVTTNNRVCSTIDYCSVFSNRYVLNDGPYTFLNSEALVEKLFAINFC